MNTLIKNSFRKAANTYDQAANIQRQIADDLTIYILNKEVQSKNILELGCGTGYLTHKLSTLLSFDAYIALDCAYEMLLKSQLKNKVNHIASYSERLPFHDQTFDLVTSNLMLQWCNITETFSNVHRVLKKNGFFIATTFGNYTFSTTPYLKNWVNPLPTAQTITDLLTLCGFHDIKVWTQRYSYQSMNLFSFLRDLKKIGSCSLQPRNSLSHLLKICRHNDPCTTIYEVIYFHARRDSI